MGLFLGLAFTAGTNVDFGEIVLKHAPQPQGVPA